MDKTLLTNLKRSTQEQYLIQDEILKGNFGVPGDPFMTTQKLADLRGVSVVTAHHIMTGLCDSGFIELRGKKYFLSHSEQAEDQKNRTRIIGLLIPNINNEFYTSIAEAVIRLAGQQGYRVLVMNTAYSSSEEREVHQLFLHIPVAGILSCVPSTQDNVKLYRDCPVPCVLLAHDIEGANRSSVQVNSFPVSQKIAQHLIDQGYRKFLYIGTRNIPIETDIRYLAFHTRLRREGFPMDSRDVILVSQNDRLDAKVLTGALEARTEPVGVFCYHDLLAAELYRICFKLGKKIPEDVGIVGFDDLSVSTCLCPALTTVRYRLTSMADTALKLLFQDIREPGHSYDNYYIEPNLIIRQSTDLSGQKKP